MGDPGPGHGVVRSEVERTTHSVRRGTGLVRRTTGQPREAPGGEVTKDRRQREPRRLGDADRREGGRARPARGSAGVVDGRGATGAVERQRRPRSMPAAGRWWRRTWTAVRTSRRAGPRTTRRRSSSKCARRENSLVLLRIRASVPSSSRASDGVADRVGGGLRQLRAGLLDRVGDGCADGLGGLRDDRCDRGRATAEVTVRVTGSAW